MLYYIVYTNVGEKNLVKYVHRSIKTARLLDVMSGHEGPISGLAFSPTQPLLASASWDSTCRTWDVYGGKGGQELMQHETDVLAVAYSPDGKQMATCTLQGM